MSTPQEDTQQLSLLSAFHYALGSITGLFACFPLIHVALGIAMLIGVVVTGAPPAAGLVALPFIIMGGTFCILGWTMAVCLLVAARNLQRRRHHGFCFAVACVACAFIPLGTALGVFTIIVLNRDSVKALFAAPPPIAPS